MSMTQNWLRKGLGLLLGLVSIYQMSIIYHSTYNMLTIATDQLDAADVLWSGWTVSIITFTATSACTMLVSYRIFNLKKVL